MRIEVSIGTATIQNNIIQAFSNSGITVSTAADIRGNTILLSGSLGIYIEKTSPVTIQNNLIVGTVDDTCIGVLEQENITLLANNVFHGCPNVLGIYSDTAPTQFFALADPVTLFSLGPLASGIGGLSNSDVAPGITLTFPKLVLSYTSGVTPLSFALNDTITGSITGASAKFSLVVTEGLIEITGVTGIFKKGDSIQDPSANTGTVDRVYSYFGVDPDTGMPTASTPCATVAEAGADLSPDGATDINGNPRTVPWSIGAVEMDGGCL